jgi:hypothetical protein
MTDFNPFSAPPVSAPPRARPSAGALATDSHHNPFGAPPAPAASRTPQSAAGAASSAAPALPPVPAARSLAALVDDYRVQSGPVLSCSRPPASTVPAPLPMRLVAYASAPPLPAQAPPPPPPAAAAPPPALSLEDAVALSRQQQWARVLAGVPPACELLPAAGAPAPVALGLLRCRAAALAGSRRWGAAVEDAARVCAVLAGGAAAPADAGDAAAAAAAWLCALADGLCAMGLWREAVYAAHGVCRALGGGDGGAGGGESEVGEGGEGGWLEPAGGGGGGGGCGNGPPAAAPAVAAAARSALAFLARHAGAIPPRAASRYALVASGIVAGALTGAGFLSAAAAAAGSAAAATAALAAAAAADAATQAADMVAASAVGRATGGDGGLQWALSGPSEWVVAGLALLAFARTQRALARGGGGGGEGGGGGGGGTPPRPPAAVRADAEASSALASLFAIPQWRAAGDLLLAAVGGTVGASELCALSPATAYAAGVLGCVRGAEALAVGRPAEALPLFEAALVALSRRFLPLPVEAGGAPPGPFDSAALSLARASAVTTGSAGGLSLLPPRGAGALASAHLPRGFLPDPADLLVEAAVGAAEALRKLPPAPPAGGSVTPPTPPIVVATGLLEATLRAAPGVLLRSGLVHTIAGLYEAGKDAMAAAAAKRVLAAIAGAWGVQHLGPDVFRLPAAGAQ